jgi:hypothetical protein
VDKVQTWWDEPMAPQLLSDAEFALRNIPERFGDKRAMNLEELDGFLAAMICGPAFTFQPLLQDVFSLIIRYRDAVTHIVRSGEVFYAFASRG